VKSRLIDRVFCPLFDEGATAAPRSELCAGVLLEAEGARKGALVDLAIARDAGGLALGAPGDQARVFSGVSLAFTKGILAGTPWADVPIESLEAGIGANEAGGAAALGAAFRALERGDVKHALVVGKNDHELYAVELGPRVA
jgi:hypothetical protein